MLHQCWPIFVASSFYALAIKARLVAYKANYVDLDLWCGEQHPATTTMAKVSQCPSKNVHWCKMPKEVRPTVLWCGRPQKSPLLAMLNGA